MEADWGMMGGGGVASSPPKEPVYTIDSLYGVPEWASESPHWKFSKWKEWYAWYPVTVKEWQR